MDEISKITEKLKTKLDCIAIILFGSYSRNTQRENSDIDIAIKSKCEISKIELFEISQELEEITKKDIDLIDLEKISDSFRYEILMNGQVLFCENDVEFDLYKLEMFREYLELNESRKDIIDNIKKGGTIYGK